MLPHSASCHPPLKKTALLFLLFCLQYSMAAGQTKTIDSLRQLYYAAPAPKEELSTLLLLCEQVNSLHPDSLYVYYTRAHALALKEKNKQAIVQTDLYKAIYFSRRGALDTAGAIIDQSLSRLTGTADIPLRFRFLILKSNVLIRSDKQKESMTNSLQLLREAEQSGDYLTQVRAKISIGWAYMELEQSRDALNWFLEAEKMEKTVEESKRQPSLYSNMAAVYNNLTKNDSAELYIKESIRLALKRNDLTFLANAYFIYAGIYNALNYKKRNEALLQEGLRIRKLIGDPFYIVSDIFQIGLFYAHNGETGKGIAITKEGIAIAQKNNLPAKLPILYAALAENYKAAGNLTQYSETLNTIITLKDSLYEKNSADALAEMHTKYEVQKKENTIIQQQYDITRKNYFIYSIVGLLVMTLLFGFFFFRNRKKSQRLKMHALAMEQKKQTTQAVMEAEEEERKRIAGDLHDSVAQKMVVAKLNLEALGNQLPNLDERKQKIYNNINALLEESTIEVRNLSHSMMPQAFAKTGLANTVQLFLDKIEKPGLAIHFSADGDFANIKEQTALMVYRILQECVQNVLKHAGASTLDIAMIAEQKEIDITIEDNGAGFDMKALNGHVSNGLKSIRSRMQYLNGTLDMNSQPGKGTMIALYIPLPQF